MYKMKFSWNKLVCCTSLMLALIGCGTMKVKETYYYAVEDETNTNIYRLQIQAKTVLGDAKFREGFFPANAVDRAFGAVSDSSGNADLQFQETLKAQIREATLHTTQNYLSNYRGQNNNYRGQNKVKSNSAIRTYLLIISVTIQNS